MSIQFLKGDCLERMKDVSGGSVDLFVCDLPYGCLSKTEVNVKRGVDGFADGGKAMSACAWDVKIDLKAFWEQVKRLAKHDHVPVLMFCNTKFGIDLINSNPSWFRYDLVWDKEQGVSFLLANKQPMKSHEMIYVFSKAGAFYNRIDVEGGTPYKATKGNKHKAGHHVAPVSGVCKGVGQPEGKRCPLSVIRVPRKVGCGAKGHPTEKPEELYEWLISRYCPPGGTVLDPTAGSFNSCVVAKRLGHNAIGIEKDEGFYNKAVAKDTTITHT